MTSMLLFASAANVEQQVAPASSAFLAAKKLPRPEGRPPWMAAVFGPRQDAESENPGATRTLVQALCRLVLSLVTFFAPAKKVTRLQAKAFDLFPLGKGGNQDQTRFALSREFISFAGPKETNQRKGPSPTRRNGNRLAGRDFRTRHPGSIQKRRTSMCAALRVWLARWLFAREAKAAAWMHAGKAQ